MMLARELLVIGALLAFPSGVVSAAPDADSTATALAETAEERFEALAASFEIALAEAGADLSFDEIAVLEAEAIAGVAEELLEEGDAELAAELLAEALALLAPPE